MTLINRNTVLLLGGIGVVMLVVIVMFLVKEAGL